jgi:hypothetical protein
MLKISIKEQNINSKGPKFNAKNYQLLKFRVYNIQESFMNYVSF